MNINIIAVGLATLILGTSGCSINPGSSPDFRASVNNMHRQQTQNPNAANVPPAAAVKPIEGDIAASVMENHRETAASREDSVSTQITINTGN